MDSPAPRPGGGQSSSRPLGGRPNLGCPGKPRRPSPWWSAPPGSCSCIYFFRTHDSPTMMGTLSEIMGGLPSALRYSLTWDQSSEMAAVASLPAATDTGDLFLRPPQPLARRHQLELRRPPAKVLPQRHQPSVHVTRKFTRVQHLLNKRPRLVQRRTHQSRPNKCLPQPQMRRARIRTY